MIMYGITYDITLVLISRYIAGAAGSLCGRYLGVPYVKAGKSLSDQFGEGGLAGSFSFITRRYYGIISICCGYFITALLGEPF